MAEETDLGRQTVYRINDAPAAADAASQRGERERAMNRRWETFTPKQGRCEVFLHPYTRLHRRPLAATDIQDFFRVSPPSGLIQPRPPRSIARLVDPKQLPELV